MPSQSQFQPMRNIGYLPARLGGEVVRAPRRGLGVRLEADGLEVVADRLELALRVRHVRPADVGRVPEVEGEVGHRRTRRSAALAFSGS